MSQPCNRRPLLACKGFLAQLHKSPRFKYKRSPADVLRQLPCHCRLLMVCIRSHLNLRVSHGPAGARWERMEGTEGKRKGPENITAAACLVPYLDTAIPPLGTGGEKATLGCEAGSATTPPAAPLAAGKCLRAGLNKAQQAAERAFRCMRLNTQLKKL